MTLSSTMKTGKTFYHTCAIGRDNKEDLTIAQLAKRLALLLRMQFLWCDVNEKMEGELPYD